MKKEEQVLKLMDAKKKLYSYLIEQRKETPFSEIVKFLHIEKMIEIQENEIELLEWILSLDE